MTLQRRSAGQITHYLTDAQYASLFQRIYAALSPGCVFVINRLEELKTFPLGQ